MASGERYEQVYEPNPALRVLNRWFFDKIQVDESWVSQVREVSKRGTVVYILRSLNLLDYLALDYLTKRFDLPRIRYVNDLYLGVIGPGHAGLSGMLKAFALPSEPEQLRTA